MDDHDPADAPQPASLNASFETSASDSFLADATENDEDGFREECGVFGILGHPDAAVLTALGLHALQHRGQEAAGIVAFDNKEGRFNSERHLGLVADHFDQHKKRTEKLPGTMAIGHVRYSTAGQRMALRNVQPLYADLPSGGLAVAHNGNLTNTRALRRSLVSRGAIFQSTSDTETILHLVATSVAARLTDRLADALTKVEGAYSLVCLTQKEMVGIRDPHGVRPLVLGQLNGALILTSETCALDIIGAEFIREVEPGEMIVLQEGKEPISLRPFAPRPSRFCVFEFVYFSRPDSIIKGQGVYEARRRIGQELAREAYVEADVVCPVPDGGVPGAIGYAEGAGITLDFGIIRNHYVGRTFIQPTDGSRKHGVRMKHNANRTVLEGKRVVLVDDSIVRGTTSSKIVGMVRNAGAKEIHMRVASPPTIGACHYGVDTPETDKLLASRMDLEEIRKHLGVESIAFVSIDGLYRAMGFPGRDNTRPQYCDACFSRDYPIRLTDLEDGDPSDQLSFLQN